ncbi:MAG: 23S rRNA (guanosine(2251)-2'-O)-methyltransferase RlmB, partial [Oscillospiraceae bacterium]|nr:23S rRNA (guanosine(2251)-2'-O)-methyltransferase RlmB [Oscillospiraceae bacterium]
RNAVIEALRAGVKIDKVFIAKGETDTALGYIASVAREAGAVVVEADRRKLDRLCCDAAGADIPGERTKYVRQGDDNSDGKNGDSGGRGGYVHQGVVAVVSQTDYATVEDILDFAGQKAEKPLIIICDEITDPHNLGAIIRTGYAAGAHGVIIPKRRNAGLSPAVVKASSGAVFHVKVARVPNIVAAIKKLKEAGVWIFAAEPDGKSSLWESDLTDATAIVIGAEGKGIGRLVGENCDFKVCIPMKGKISSLNASVSASILLYEALRQRR